MSDRMIIKMCSMLHIKLYPIVPIKENKIL